MICPNCKALFGIVDLDHLTGGHHPGGHGHIHHDPNHESHGEMGWGGWLMLGLAVASAVGMLFADNGPHYHHHCNNCGHNW